MSSCDLSQAVGHRDAKEFQLLREFSAHGCSRSGTPVELPLVTSRAWGSGFGV